MNRTIRARIHETAVKRVTRIYTATLADIFAETLQNSRRAGARRVRISVAAAPAHETAAIAGETPLTVTVSDDGIADPAVLLSFGENGWDDALVRREDAAGFGFASLARRNCAVSSRPRSPDGETLPGWHVALQPAHFLGEADAGVQGDNEAPYPCGTAVSFEATKPALAIRNAAGNAARHYPLPVVFEDGGGDGAGEELPRRAFLDGAVHVEPWRGLVFGVFKDRRSGYNDPDLNFFGLTLALRLPTVETVHGATWTVLADLEDCPDLELVLPARKEAVENAFPGEMREAARLAVWRAMAADPSPRPAFADWTRARKAGIAIAPPPAALRPWRPMIADCNDWREPGKLADAGHDALVMDRDPEPPEAQALWRAAERAGIAPRLFEADRRLEGHGWYDALDRVTDIAVRVAAGDDWTTLAEYPLPGPSRAAAGPPRRHPHRARRPPDVGSGTHPRPAGRHGVRRRGLVLDRRGHAAGHRRQPTSAARARRAAHGGVLFALRRCRRRQLGDPAQPLRGGRAAPGDPPAAVRRRGLPGIHRRGGAARADVACAPRPRRRHPHPPTRRDRDPRRRKRGGRRPTASALPRSRPGAAVRRDGSPSRETAAMTLAAMPAPEATAPRDPGDEVRKRAIAVWTDLLMPPDRTVTIAVTDGRVAVELGPDPEVPAR